MNRASLPETLPRKTGPKAGSCRVDVIVIGGGPSGTSTAIGLARAGYSVTVLERSRYEVPRIGETLPPQIQPLLAELGVLHRFLAGGHVRSPGIVVAWGQTELYENDFIVNPYGPGWHVDRRRFDAMLADAASALGAEVILGAQPTACVRIDSDLWNVKSVVDGIPLVREGNVLVDATGRSSSPARRLGGHRLVHDRLVGLVGLLQPVRDESGCDRRTWVEAVEHGWWYTAPLPDGQHIAAFFSDADLIPRGRSALDRFWRNELTHACHVRARVEREWPSINLRTLPASSTRLQKAGSPGWLAVGDAAAAFDPLSSCGITWALGSGQAAARAIDAYYRGDRLALDGYKRWIEEEFADYLRKRAEYYSRERRWPECPFWKRRHGRRDALEQ